MSARRFSSRYTIETPAFSWGELARGLGLFATTGGLLWLLSVMTKG